jgi:hypothetical protein
MTSSSEHSARIRRTTYEPPAELLQPSVVACPHCGGSVPIGTSSKRGHEREQPMEADVVAPLPDAREVEGPVAAVLRMVLEVIDARRPLAHLDAAVAPSVLRYVRAARLAARPARIARLVRLRVCRPTRHTAEAAAVVTIDRRVRAVAARFEREPSGWRCVALRIL